MEVLDLMICLNLGEILICVGGGIVKVGNVDLGGLLFVCYGEGWVFVGLFVGFEELNLKVVGMYIDVIRYVDWICMVMVMYELIFDDEIDMGIGGFFLFLDCEFLIVWIIVL